MRKTSILFVLLFNGLLGQHYQVDFQPDEFKQLFLKQLRCHWRFIPLLFMKLFLI